LLRNSFNIDFCLWIYSFLYLPVLQLFYWLPPGLLNMTAAKVNLKEGKKCIWFVLEQLLFFSSLSCDFVCSCYQCSSWYCCITARSRFCFGALTVYFMDSQVLKLKKQKSKKAVKRNVFFRNVTSALNFFQFYYVL
jgi:hypothetical protein